jgi:hypothetical protein
MTKQSKENERAKKPAHHSVDLSKAQGLLQSGPSVVHLGLSEVADGPRGAGVPVSEVRFQPPAGGDEEKIKKLAELTGKNLSERIRSANREALGRFLQSEPNLVGVGVAGKDLPGMEPNLFLHAGPPIEWERASGPLRGAVIGGALLEGLAETPEEAEKLAASGEIKLEPCHHHQAVGPMAGLITSSMPVWIVEDGATSGGGGRSKTFCTLNEGLGKVLRYGAYAPEVIERLRFMATVLAPVLSQTLEKRGPIDLKVMMAQALQMGDEGHNRNRAATSLLFRELAPAMVTLDRPKEEISRVLSFIHGNDHFFLNLSMPMAKCMLKAAEGVAYSSMLTVMARNGTDFGVRVSGLGDRWFTGPAQIVDGLLFPGYTEQDANPDIGDSAIMETAGLGGFVMAASPAIVQFVGGTVEDAMSTTRRMGRITVGRNDTWAIPPLDFVGAPTGIDLLSVVELDTLPAINTGVAHKEPGVGQVGAGLVHPPWECFNAAFDAFYETCMKQ